MDHASRFDRVAESIAVDEDIHSRPRTVVATCGIAVMAKASAPGRAKTRLVPPLSYDEAAALNTAFLQDVTDNMLLGGTSRRATRRHRGLRGLRTARVGGFFPPQLLGSHRIDSGVAAEFRRLPVPHDQRDFCARSRRGRRAQRRQSHFADRAAQRDRRDAGTARRPRRARPVERRRLLSARPQGARTAACSTT